MELNKQTIVLPDGNTAIKIDKYEHYFVTENGEVWSEKSKKYLSQKVYGKYKIVRLYSGGYAKTVNVHSLVAEAFIPKLDPQKNTVNHIDEDKENNHASNLEWVTHEENMVHSNIQEKAAAATRKPVYLYTKDGEFVESYDSQTAAGEALGVTARAVSAAFNKPGRSCKGYLVLSAPQGV